MIFNINQKSALHFKMTLTLPLYFPSSIIISNTSWAETLDPKTKVRLLSLAMLLINWTISFAFCFAISVSQTIVKLWMISLLVAKSLLILILKVSVLFETLMVTSQIVLSLQRKHKSKNCLYYNLIFIWLISIKSTDSSASMHTLFTFVETAVS